MRKIVLACVACMALSGCVGTIAAVGGVVGIAATAYCAGVSDAGRQVVQNAVTAGQKVIACDD